MTRLAIIATVAALALTGVAHAEDAASVTTVSSRGLDLNAPTDAKVYYERLKTAVAGVCGGGAYYMPSEQERYDDCQKTTLDVAVAHSGSSMVAALHSGREPAIRYAAR